MSPRRPASHRTLRAVAIVVVMVAPSLLACGGKDLDVGYDDTAIANVNPAAPVDMNAVHARCGAPGTDAPFDFSVPAVTVLTGRWFLCEGTDPAALAAIELTADVYPAGPRPPPPAGLPPPRRKINAPRPPPTTRASTSATRRTPASTRRPRP